MNVFAAQRCSLACDAEPCVSGRPSCSSLTRATPYCAMSRPSVGFLARQKPLLNLRSTVSYSPVRRRRLCIVSGQDLGNLISSQDEFDESVKAKPVVVVDWMARWCRKCIYLKPKIAKLLEEEFPDLPVVFIDVNAVPGNLVYDHGIRKMPTITIYRDGQKVREHIAAEGGLKAVTAIREMIKEYVEKEGVTATSTGTTDE